jgi:hypothetical protein
MHYYDIGEDDIINPSMNRLGKIMDALIRCRGKLHDSHSLDLSGTDWKHSCRSCAIVLRVSIPIGLENTFQEIAGVRLTLPARVGV